MEEVKLNLFMMGKTGQGKSATRNTILNRNVVKPFCDTASKTKEFSFYFAQFEKYELLLVDGPGLEEMDTAQDMITAVKNMDRVLGMCYGGVDTFLFVIMFGQTFTDEDKNTLEALGRIHGGRFMEHVVVVVTCGDRFQADMKERETPDKSFHEWCREQRGALLKLYEDCGRRFVLFNNYEKDDEKRRAQILEVVQLARELQTRSGRYTSEYFKMSEYELEKQIRQLKAPQLIGEFREKIGLLSVAIEDFTARHSDDTMEQLRARTGNLKKEIEHLFTSYNVRQELLVTISRVEENLKEVEKLLVLIKGLNKIRQAKAAWVGVGAVCTVAGVAIAALAPSVALGLAVGSAIVSGARYLSLASEEQNNGQQQEQLRTHNEALSNWRPRHKEFQG